jgi:hypothetical protein
MSKSKSPSQSSAPRSRRSTPPLVAAAIVAAGILGGCGVGSGSGGSSLSSSYASSSSDVNPLEVIGAAFAIGVAIAEASNR